MPFLLFFMMALVSSVAAHLLVFFYEIICNAEVELAQIVLFFNFVFILLILGGLSPSSLWTKFSQWYFSQAKALLANGELACINQKPFGEG